jgi:hypothetical protein
MNKWCPFVRLQAGTREGVAINREPYGTPIGLCVGKGCMAFRVRNEWRHPGSLWRSGGDDGGGVVETRTVVWCGLAGPPADGDA